MSEAGVWSEVVLDGPVALGLYFMLGIGMNSSVSHTAGSTWLQG